MKKYMKKKSSKKGPNAAGPKYRTPDHFSPRIRSSEAGKAGKFSSSGKPPSKRAQLSFKPAQFKVQHKG